MKIIIGGGGTVGRGIAASLAAEGNDVTMIDQDKNLVDGARAVLDIRAFQGHISDPETLEKAGAGDSDMLIAVTLHDEINIMACKTAHVLFSVPVKIARVRRQSYLQPAWHNLFSYENLPIDLIISPEIEVSKAIIAWLEHPGAFENISFSGGFYHLVSTLCDQACPVLGTSLRDLSKHFPELFSVIVAISREGTLFAVKGDDVIKPGDIVYFIATPDQIRRTLGLFGRDDKTGNNLVMAGGGNVGYNVIKSLNNIGKQAKIRLIEHSEVRAQFIAETFDQIMVLQGSGMDRSLLAEADIQDADVFLALTNDDQANFISLMNARDSGCKNSLCLLNHSDYHHLMRAHGLGSFINPRSITIARILQHIRRGRIKGVYPVENGAGEIIEAEALETSPLIGRTLKDIGLENGIRIGGIVRNNAPVLPTADTRIQAQDQLILFAQREKVKKAEQLFRVGIEYFT